VAVRQHRRTLLAALAFVVVAVAVLAASQVWSIRADDALGAAGCSPDSIDPRCSQSARDHADAQWQVRSLLDYTGLGLLLLPGLLAAYTAGPLIARELESGTYKLAWTQSVTPARWLAAKLSVSAAFVSVCVLLLTAVFHWSWQSGAIDDYPTFWYEPTVYAAILGTVPLATALLGLSLGALVGLLVRRTVVAMSAAALLTGAVLAVLAQLRPHLWAVQTLTGHGPDLPVGAWRLESGMLTASGQRLPWTDCIRALEAEQEAAWCLTAHDGVTEYADIHPASHFWPIQLIETGIVLAVAALALLAAFRVLRARHP
jgi:hypothetical protein